MIESNLHIEPLANLEEIPFDLLELADPSRKLVESYLSIGTCHIARFDTKIVGVVVLNQVDSKTMEIKNIAVRETEQRKGFGKALLLYSGEISLKSGCERLLIGTGNSSIGQLALYKKTGFEIDRIDKNFFLRNYTEQIIENGIQCKDMIILKKNLR